MKIIVDNVATEYKDEGSGPVLLMLHGWKDSLRTFDALIPGLVGKYRIVRLDLPGFGGSELPPAAWGVPEYTTFVAACIQKLALRPAAIIGHSFGGRVAIYGTAHGLLSTEKVVLIGAAGVAERRSFRNASLRALAKVAKIATLPLPQRVKDSLRTRLYAGIKSDYAQTGALRETFLKTISLDLSTAAAKIRVPALLIWGSADTQTPLEEGVRMSTLIKGSTFRLVHSAGHFVHAERPAEVAGYISEFV
jgi:pimeloyl-ACP methyl ester carboxylesterase